MGPVAMRAVRAVVVRAVVVWGVRMRAVVVRFVGMVHVRYMPVAIFKASRRIGLSGSVYMINPISVAVDIHAMFGHNVINRRWAGGRGAGRRSCRMVMRFVFMWVVMVRCMPVGNVSMGNASAR